MSVDALVITSILLPIILTIGAIVALMFNVYDPDYEFANPRPDVPIFDFKGLEMDTPDPRISGLYCRDDMMPILCLTTEEEQDSAGRKDIDPIAC